VTRATGKWDKELNDKGYVKMRQMESRLSEILIEGRVDHLAEEKRILLSNLMQKMKELLAYEETKWHLKTKSI